jgi:hypothetical protein
VIRADREPAEVFDDVRGAIERLLADRDDDGKDGSAPDGTLRG